MPLESRTTVFTVGALLGGTVSAGALYLLYRLQGGPGFPSTLRHGAATGQPGAACSSAALAARPAAAGARRQSEKPAGLADFDSDDILSEQLTRNVQFFGLDAQKRVARAFVVVVGVGVSRARVAPRAGAAWGWDWGGQRQGRLHPMPSASMPLHLALHPRLPAGRRQPRGAHAAALRRGPAAPRRL